MKLWGGRFAKNTDALMEEFHSSISFDKRLYAHDIRGSLAHAAMLERCGIISSDEAGLITQGLLDVYAAIDTGEVSFDIAAEDIHMNIEKLLTERIGEAGKKLHTARSRNDQVALDMRLYIKDEIDQTIRLLLSLEDSLIALAKEHIFTYMPGYTHLQKAQPITFAHHLMAYFQMFSRDISRLKDCRSRADEMPLGAGALAGTTFPIDRDFVAVQLGFRQVCDNTLDAVSDRDFVIEFAAAASLIMVHLSRFSEELILWSTAEFAFITMDDAYSTGSSIMPQKKNPDAAELVRGKAGRVFGHLTALLTVMKGLPLAYNKDMQEDKEALFDCVDTVKKSLTVFIPMISTMRVNTDRMKSAVRGGFINATDMADYLASKGLPFREAHEVTGRLVLLCEERGIALEDLPLPELKSHCDLFGEDIFEAISPERCVDGRNVVGGPAYIAMREAISKAEAFLTECAEWRV